MNAANPSPQTIAKQIAQEPWEILKQAGRQVAGTEQPRSSDTQGEIGREGTVEQQQNEKLLAERDKVRSQRLIEALLAELRDKTKGDLIKDLQAKIANGEAVYLENYPQLTAEEKEMLKKQIETVAIQKQQLQNQNQGLVEPATKKGRRLFNFGKKTQMQRQQTQTERPLPPSG